MKKNILLTESQMLKINDMLNTNSIIQKLLFNEPSDINFKITDEDSMCDDVDIIPIVDGKEIGDNLVKIKGKKTILNNIPFTQVSIKLCEDIQQLGIGEKLYKALLNEGFNICSINQRNSRIEKITEKICYEGPYLKENITNNYGDIVGYTLIRSNYNILLSEGRIYDLFKDCTNFRDFSHKILLVASIGTIMTISSLISIVKNYPSGTDQQKQELITQLENEDVKEEEAPKKVEKQIVYATSFTISQEGLEHIKSYEKLSLTPYYATKYEAKHDIKTIGYGHVIKATDPQWLRKATSITEQQANELFANDMETYVGEFNRYIRRLPKQLRDPNLYTQGFIDAAISMLYNSGAKNFLHSDFFETWKRCNIDKQTGKIKIEDYNFTASKIKTSNIMQGGKVLQGLKDRRNKESKMAQIK